VTDVEAKELLIGGMNYAAYHETDHSLWPADKNTLFGEPHYEVGPRDGQSVWGTGEVFESKMADVLRWAIHLGTTSGDYSEAIHQLMSGEHYINRIIKRAGVSDV
jgi:hypothetical protein